MSHPIPDWQSLVEEVEDRATTNSALHGPAHWRRVAIAGAKLLEKGVEADCETVFLFALFHDSMRLNDGHDPDHGKRGGELARELHNDLHFLSAEQMDLLQFACEDHEKGHTRDDPTVGLCWDSDRLNLPRCGVRSNPALLSTATARKKGIIRFATTKLFSSEACWGWEFIAEELLGLPKPPPPVRTFVRFGEPSPDGFSRWRMPDGTTKVREPGISCYHAAKTRRGYEVLPGNTILALGYIMAWSPYGRVAYLGEARDAYELSGEIVGTGSGGEPCLRVAHCEPIPEDAAIWCEKTMESRIKMAFWRETGARLPSDRRSAREFWARMDNDGRGRRRSAFLFTG